MAQNITVYTTNDCKFCGMVKQYFDTKGMAYDVVNVEEQPERQKEVLELSGMLSVPVTNVVNDDGSNKVIVGYNLAELSTVAA